MLGNPIEEANHNDEWARIQAQKNRERMAAEKPIKSPSYASRQPKLSKEEKKKQLDGKLSKIFAKLESVISSCVPDCDPMEYMVPFLNAIGVPQNDYIKWLNRAVKDTSVYYKNYDDYLISQWDSYAAAVGEPDRPNPWK